MTAVVDGVTTRPKEPESAVRSGIDVPADVGVVAAHVEHQEEVHEHLQRIKAWSCGWRCTLCKSKPVVLASTCSRSVVLENVLI